MPSERKVIKDTKLDSYEQWYANQSKKSEAKNQKVFARRKEISSAEEHERRKRGDMSGEPTIGKALMSLVGKSIDRQAAIRSARQHEENKARGTSSSSVRTIIK